MSSSHGTSNGHLQAQPRAVHALMSGLIDYAGLFPPAKLSMRASIEAYAKYAASDESWMLGRFILPVSKLEEFRKAGADLLPRKREDAAEAGWPISAIIDGDLDENLDSIFTFNAQHAEPKQGLAVIDAVEIKVPPTSESNPSPSIEFIEQSLEIMAEGVYPFFELGIGVPRLSEPGGSKARPAEPGYPDLRGAIAALAGADAGAKVRTGGITPDAIPGSLQVAEFIVGCAQADVPFKATAGLHHAIRAEHPLTYEPNCPRAVMHGFLNVFIAAAMVQEYRIDAAAAAKILEEADVRKFLIDAETVAWGPGRLTIEQVERTRDTFALSYGSCSFDEPVAELKSLGLI